MSKTAIFGVVLILVALDWTALDDITTGKEPNYFLECLTLAISLFIFTFIGFTIVRRRKNKR